MTNLFENKDIVLCARCSARCKNMPVPNSKAKMLKRGVGEKGSLCISCAVHDWLRNTYPVNRILAGMQNPKYLLLPHIQEQFTGIMRAGFSDARPDEIDWQLIVDNWDLPWPNKVKATAMNPMSQELLDREPAELAKREAILKEEFKSKEKRKKERDEKVIEAMNDFLNAVNPDRPERKYQCHENESHSIIIDGYEDIQADNSDGQ